MVKIRTAVFTPYKYMLQALTAAALSTVHLCIGGIKEKDKAKMQTI